MSVEGTGTDVVDFLRREAPIELERLESIARLVASDSDPVPGRPVPGESSYAAWLRTTFGIFEPRFSGETVHGR